MKKILIIILLALELTACKKNFNEITDTDQRQVTFLFDSSNCFDEILTSSENGFSLGFSPILEGNNRLRITAYCYDFNDSIVTSKYLLSNNIEENILTFRHLNKDTEYHFVFVADIVEYDAHVDYYERWFQMGTKKWESFYVTRSSHSDVDAYNVILSKQMNIIPDNDTVKVSMEPITCNGFFVLENANIARRLSGYLVYSDFFYLKNMHSDVGYYKNFYFFRPNEQKIIIPFTIGKIKQKISVKVRVDDSHEYDSIVFSFHNSKNRPLVIKIDCDSLSSKQITYY